MPLVIEVTCDAFTWVWRGKTDAEVAPDHRNGVRPTVGETLHRRDTVDDVGLGMTFLSQHRRKATGDHRCEFALCFNEFVSAKGTDRVDKGCRQRIFLEIVMARMSHSPRSAKACSMASANTSSQSPVMSVSKTIGVTVFSDALCRDAFFEDKGGAVSAASDVVAATNAAVSNTTISRDSLRIILFSFQVFHARRPSRPPR